ncbi:MAG TPA: hypothetical protein VHI13_20170 [Candidatus Kapabacteria bacterium]|nr:hypothetical protein [Candidatus Kapabacteria bacterium]
MIPQTIGRYAERDVVLRTFSTLDDAGVDRHPEAALLLWVLDPGWEVERFADAVARLLESPVAFLTVSGPRIEEMFMAMIDTMNGWPTEPTTVMNVIAGLNVADSLHEFLDAASGHGGAGTDMVIVLVGDPEITGIVGGMLADCMGEIGG